MKTFSILKLVYSKPKNCPNCGNTYFSQDGVGYWRCNKCGWRIRD